MKFTADLMRRIACNDSDRYEVVTKTIVDTSRWAIQYEAIFKDLNTNMHYRTYWQVGATEQQDERPFEYDTGEIECDEVELVEVFVKEWRKVK